MPQSPNNVLAALPAGEYRRIRPLLRTLSLSAEAPLPHCGATRVYFPGSGLCSIMNRMADGSVIEIACVGKEGLIGLSALAGEFPAERNGFVQVGDGTVQYMPLTLFERELARNGTLRGVVDRFCHAFLETMVQSVACNRLHTFQERCARWLLSAHDRLGRARFELKARFLARAMGTKTADVAGVLANLEKLGVIRYDDTSVTILDAVGLRRLACRCYEVMRRGYTLAVPVARKPPDKEASDARARILPMRAVAGTCTLCGSTARVPHKNGHDCIVALDEEIAALLHKMHTLRKYRAQLLASRAQMFRDILKRSRSS